MVYFSTIHSAHGNRKELVGPLKIPKEWDKKGIHEITAILSIKLSTGMRGVQSPSLHLHLHLAVVLSGLGAGPVTPGAILPFQEPPSSEAFASGVAESHMQDPGLSVDAGGSGYLL